MNNAAQIAYGGGGTRDFSDTNYIPPAHVINGLALAEVRGSDTGDSGYVIGNVNATTGQFEILINCYASDATHYKAFVTGAGIYK